jgi:cell division protein FtsI/penicillin-binding protein 2
VCCVDGIRTATVIRLVDVQAVDHHYEAMALAHVHSVTLPAERGSIFDRDGNELALSVPQQSVYADPRVIRDPARYARKLAPIVHVNTSDLRDRLAQRDMEFVYVARTVDDATAAKVKKLDLPGIGFVPESKRFYLAEGWPVPSSGIRGRTTRASAGSSTSSTGSCGAGTPRRRGRPERPGDPGDPAHGRPGPAGR